MTSVTTGHRAETAAANYLEQTGFVILASNWRNRYGEIDLVAQNNDVIYFVEVKYRRNNYQGTGLDYITPIKLKQMTFAARMWIHNHSVQSGQDFRLAAIEVSGPNYQVSEIIELV